MTMNVRQELCAVMVFAVVDKAGSVVMEHGEEVRNPGEWYSFTCSAKSESVWHNFAWGRSLSMKIFDSIQRSNVEVGSFLKKY